MNNNKILITGGSGFIGTNFIELLDNKGYQILNFDKNAPSKTVHSQYWFNGNILDSGTLKQVFDEFKPTIVIHLAARTDTVSNDLNDYLENTKGTENVITAIENCSSVNRAVITSTQYVYKSSIYPFPAKDDDYVPHTTYGISKKITEEITRKSSMKCIWTIIRPCNVWGPWNMRYPQELWRILDMGLYTHPTRKPVIRTYAYVKNVTHQIEAIIIAEKEIVNKKTFYLGELPIDSYIWLNELSFQLKRKKIIHLPQLFFRFVAIFGDILRLLNINFPLYSQRLNNMVEDYYAPTNITVKEFGSYSDNLSICMKETNDWIMGEGSHFFKYWKKKKKNK
jgi:nucleoside-diphosphate-sugar epimerase